MREHLQAWWTFLSFLLLSWSSSSSSYLANRRLRLGIIQFIPSDDLSADIVVVVGIQWLWFGSKIVAVVVMTSLA